MRTIKFLMDTVFYSSKPQNAKDIQLRMYGAVCRVEGTPEEMLQGCLEGYTIKPAFYEVGGVSKAYFKSTDVIAIDVDDANVTIADTIEKSKKYHLPMIGIYKTFSYSEEHQKHRGLMLLPYTITDYREYELLMVMVQQVFNGDGQATDAARLFYGAKEGSEPIHTNYEECINLDNLVAAFYEAVRAKSGTDNYSRDLKNIAGKVGLDVVGGMLDLQVEDGKLKANFKVDNFQNTKSGKLKKVYSPSSIPVTGYGNEEYDFKGKLVGECSLFTEFTNGTHWVDHSEIFFLVSNLHRFKGGMEFIKQTMRDNPKYYNDQALCIDAYMNKVNTCLSQVINHENTANCDKYCERECPLGSKYGSPYKSVKSMTLTSVDFAGGEYNRVERKALKDVRESTFKAIHDLIDNAATNKVGIIKAATGIGKTEALVQYPWEKVEGVVAIAFPNHDLKEAAVQRFRNAGRAIAVQPKMVQLHNGEAQQKVNALYERRMYREAKRIYMDEIKKGKDTFLEYSQYLADVEGLSGCQLIATTHMDALLNGGKFNLIIYDEDVLFTSMSQGTVRMDAIKRDVKVIGRISKDYSRTEAILNFLESDTVTLKLMDIPANDTEMEQVRGGIDSSIWDDNLYAIYSSDYLLKSGDELVYGTKIKLPEVPSIIMSATLNMDVFNREFDNPKMVDTGMVGDGGKLIQFFDHSFSRQMLGNENNHDEYIQYLNECIDSQGMSVVDVTALTYKTMKKFNEVLEKEGYTVEDSVYFGKSSGFDHLKGKNLAVIGSPNITDAAYKMYALLLFGDGFNVHEKINTKTKLENTGLSVRYPTFEDKTLSTVQRYVLESELLQMIGRARLVNYPECRVLLFSRYPLQESEVVIYKDKATNEYHTLIK